MVQKSRETDSSNPKLEVTDMKETYHVNVNCTNCGYTQNGMAIKKGTQVEEVPCPKCGCITLTQGLFSIQGNPWSPTPSLPDPWKDSQPIWRPFFVETPPINKDRSCAAESCAKEIRKRQNLPPGAIVPVAIWCPCPKCSGGIRC